MDYPLTKRQRCAQIENALLLERQSFEDHWRDLAQFVKPRRIRLQITERNKGQKVNAKIIDSTACDALQLLVANLSSGMSSPSVPWMELVPEDKTLAENRQVKQWFETETAATLNDFEQTNLYAALAMLYSDAAMFGTGVMAVLEDEEQLFRCYPYQVGSYAIGMNDKQEVDTFFRKSSMRVFDLVEKYGIENVSQSTKSQYERKQFNEYIEYAQVIAPNPDYDPAKVSAKYKAWASWVYECSQPDDEFLEEKGFDEFPIIVGIWEKGDGDTYGTDCPGMRALGDIKQLQTMTKRLAQMIELAVNPSLQAPTSFNHGTVVDMSPGAVNFYDETQANKGIRPFREINMQGIAAMIEEMDRIRRRINDTFYKSIFLLVSSDQDTGRTATEIFERRQEKLMAMGPILGQFLGTYNQLIDRVFGIRSRAGLVAEPPPEMEGQRFRVNCTSIVARAQKTAAVDPIRQFLAEAAALVGVDPTVLRKVDIPKALEIIATARGVPVEVVRSEEEYQALVQQDQQAVQAQMQAEQANQLAQAGKNLGTTPMNQDSALDRVLQGVGA